MGLFSRNNDDRDRDMAEAIERGKRQGSELLRVKRAHAEWDADRPAPERASGGTSGPSCQSASTPKRGRFW
jgi:hypothetical protein